MDFITTAMAAEALQLTDDGRFGRELELGTLGTALDLAWRETLRGSNLIHVVGEQFDKLTNSELDVESLTTPELEFKENGSLHDLAAWFNVVPSVLARQLRDRFAQHRHVLVGPLRLEVDVEARKRRKLQLRVAAIPILLPRKEA